MSPSPKPGTYSSSLMISLQKPADTRLVVSLNGSPFVENESAILLSVSSGEQRSFTIDTELRSLLPDSAILSKESFTWKIDMLPPSAPLFSSKYVQGGRIITISLDEPGLVEYQLFHPFSFASGTGSILSGETLFLPDGAFFCATGIDAAGNRGPSGSPGNPPRKTEAVPFKVINPVPGNWSNTQVLLIDSENETEIRYSLDGSDPAVSGLAYTGPVMLESEGITSLKIFATDSARSEFRDQVLFTVTPRENPAGLKNSEHSIFLETGEFTELQIPANYSYSLGDAVPSTEGGKSILFSAVRGIRKYYPLSVTDGNFTWRWVCANGNIASPSSTENSSILIRSPSESGNEPGSPEITINDWYFIGIYYSFPLYYSLDNIKWTLYSIPVFVDRATDRSFYWYSPSWKNAEVQSIRLPEKPKLAGVPENSLTGNPVFLSAGDSPFTFFYEAGADYSPSIPQEGSPQLSSGLLIEVPNGASSVFNIRLLAMYDGLVHGELNTRFIEDRKAPRSPSPFFSSDAAYSRTPVSFSPSGEDLIQVTVTPSLYSTDGEKFILQGDSSRKIEYLVSLFALDEAGNKSPVVERKITVDLNALYVDSSYSGDIKRDGSPSAPWSTIDDALDAVRGTGDWRIYVHGSTTLSRTHTIQARVQIIGSDALIFPAKGISLLVSGGALSLSGCTITQISPDADGTVLTGFDTDRVSVLFDIRNGEFSADGLEVKRTVLHTGALLRSNGSKIICRKSRFELVAREYALLFDINNSELSVENCSFSVSALNSSVLSLTSVKASISISSFYVTAASAGRAIESWNSQISLKDLSIERKDENSANRDTAFWFDPQTRVISEAGVVVKGFWRYKPSENR